MKRKMLLVDDDAQIVHSLSRYMELEEGWEFHSAHSADEGVRKLGEVEPDVLVLDCNLGTSDTDGLDLLKNLRRSERYKNLPVLLLSGVRIESEQVAEGLNLGADNYARKPISPEALVSRANALLRYVQRMK